MLFTKDELHNSLIDPETSGLPALTPSLAYESTLSFLADVHAHTLFPNLMSEDSFLEEERKHPVSFISLIPEKFLQVFKSQGEAGQAQRNLSLERFKYFTLARTLNVQGTTLHSMAQSARPQSFGVVTSHRCAPLKIDKDEMVYVHLVSLDGLQNIYASQGIITGSQLSKLEDVERVSIVSLRSWTYQAIPPHSESFGTLPDDLNKTKQPRRRLDSKLRNSSASPGPPTNAPTQK